MALLSVRSRPHQRRIVYSCTQVSRELRQVYVRLLYVCLHLSAVRYAVKLLQPNLCYATILSPAHLDYNLRLIRLHADRSEYGFHIRQHGSRLGCTCSSASLRIGCSIWFADILMHFAWGYCSGFCWGLYLLVLASFLSEPLPTPTRQTPSPTTNASRLESSQQNQSPCSDASDPSVFLTD